MIRSTYAKVKGHEFTSFVAAGEAQHPRHIHWLPACVRVSWTLNGIQHVQCSCRFLEGLDLVSTSKSLAWGKNAVRFSRLRIGGVCLYSAGRTRRPVHAIAVLFRHVLETKVLDRVQTDLLQAPQ